MRAKTAYEIAQELKEQYEEAMSKTPKNDTQHLADLLHSAICHRNHDYPTHGNFCDWFANEYYPDDSKVRSEEETAGDARIECYNKAQQILTEFKFVDAMKFVKLLKE